MGYTSDSWEKHALYVAVQVVLPGVPTFCRRIELVRNQLLGLHKSVAFEPRLRVAYLERSVVFVKRKLSSSLVIGLILTAALIVSPTSAFASVWGCVSGAYRVDACENIQGSYLYVTSVQAGYQNGTGADQFGHLEIYYKLASESYKTAHLVHNTADFWYIDDSFGLHGPYWVAKWYVNKSYPNNTRMCVAAWVKQSNGYYLYDTGTICFTIHS
jgi:hypothetical protein